MDARPRFRRRQRLKRADVAAVLATGKRRRAVSVSVQVRENGLDIARFGVIVPKRHVPRAVDRNRVKRLLREWFRLQQARLQGSDVLVRVVAPLSDTGHAARDVNRLFVDEK